MPSPETVARLRKIEKLFNAEKGRVAATRDGQLCGAVQAADILSFQLEILRQNGASRTKRENAITAIDAVLDFATRTGIPSEMTAPLAGLVAALVDLDDGKSPSIFAPSARARNRPPADSSASTLKALAGAVLELLRRDLLTQFPQGAPTGAIKECENAAVSLLNNSEAWRGCGGNLMTVRAIVEARDWAISRPEGSLAYEVYQGAIGSRTAVSAPGLLAVWLSEAVWKFAASGKNN